MWRFLALSGLVLTVIKPASALEIVDILPGADALAVNWTPAGPWTFSGTDLRLLRLDTGPGGLLLERRLALEQPAVAVCVGTSYAAFLSSDGQLRLLNLETQHSGEPGTGFSSIAQDGQWLLAVQSDHYMLRASLDQPDGWGIWYFAYPGVPTALTYRDNHVWLLAADTLRGFDLAVSSPLGRTPFAHAPLTLRSNEEYVLASLGEPGLGIVDVSDPLLPGPALIWQPGFPVLDAAWWQDQLWILAAGDSGFALVDLAEGLPWLLNRWPSRARMQVLGLKGDSLLVAEGTSGLSLHLLREDAGAVRPELLARHSTRPLALAFENGQDSETQTWVLDRNQGFRCFEWDWLNPQGSPRETRGVALPLPVDGGDWRDGLITGCRYGAGLRYYEDTQSGIQLRGIHPTDPVKLLAWGPEDLVAYVTPTAYVAVKQAIRQPWMLLNHGTVNLNAIPLCAAWTADRQLLVGCNDGRLFQVDASIPTAPALVNTFHLAGPVRSLSCQTHWGFWEAGNVAIAAGKLYMLHPGASGYVLADSLALGNGACTSVAINLMWGLAGTDNPPRLHEFTHAPLGLAESDFRLLETLDVAAEPVALGRRESTGTVGLCWAGLANGDLLYVLGSDEVTVRNRQDSPTALELRSWPNPFNPVTHLSFALANATRLRLTIHDLAGRELARPLDGECAAGVQELELDAGAWPSGLYFARLETAEGSHSTSKLLLIR